ncbi:thermonuclease family protein [Thermus scotoductus]|uniref:thermonuclease family protein n=1 Tax=Thermus scotoductus TaxID=37636 RepID=UPI001F02133C|nr:hypothetical protein [Thermus scotoductus]
MVSLRLFKLLVQAGLLALFLPALALFPQGQLRGPIPVLKVVDGDTVELFGLGPVRLIGIDAPESSANERAHLQARESGQEVEGVVRLGQEAKRFAERLLSANPLSCQHGSPSSDPADP